MKNLFIALAFSALSVGAFAQTAKSGTPQKAAATVTYKCPVCSAVSKNPGYCPKDKIAYVKVGDYYCPDCYMSSEKPGKCEMCGVAMKQMK